MKKILAVAVALFAMCAFNANAQKAMATDPFNENGSINFATPTPAQEIGSFAFSDDETADPDEVPGRGMRTTGIIMTGAGVTIAAAFGGYAAYTANRTDEDLSEGIADIFTTAVSTEIAVASAAVGVVGIVLWAVGNKKMKNFKATSNGVGLAFNF